MKLAAHIWGAGDDTRAQEKVMPTLKENKVQESLLAARALQRRDKEGPLTTQQMDEMGQISSDTECSVDDIKKWLTEIRERIGPDKRKVSNDSHFEVVKKVADRVCLEKTALQTGDYEALPEPLRWSMHAGPDTGKTHVIKISKE